MNNNQKPQVNTRKTSQMGIDLIKCWEGLRTNAYLCPAKVWTIGYGHTRTAKPGMMISHNKAEELLLEDVRKYEAAVNSFCSVPITQNQFDALVSFTFNVGIAAFSQSTLLKLLNQGKYKSAALQFDRWVYAGSKKLPGLVLRREAEKQLFLK